LVTGPIKSPGPSSLARAVSDRTPSFSVCAFAVELGPHHGTRTRYPLFPYQYKDGTAVSRWPPRAAAGRENRPAGWRPVRCLVARSSRDIGKPESTPMVRIFLRARNDRVTSILLKKLPVVASAPGICGDVSEADSWLSTSCGEDARRERNELREFPEVLGCGG
jgi:hypothetical protein